MSEYKIYSLHMGKAKCAVDLGDGSERGEYVNQETTQKHKPYVLLLSAG